MNFLISIKLFIFLLFFIPMTIINLSLFKAAVLPLGSDDQICLMTQGDPHIVAPIFKGGHINAHSVDFGHFEASAFTICSKKKFTLPTTDEVKDKIEKLGIDVLTGEDLFKFRQQILNKNISLTISLPNELAWSADLAFQKATYDKLYFLNLSFKHIPHLALPPPDSLSNIKRHVSFPLDAYMKYKEFFPHGSCNLIKLEDIEKVSQLFMKNFEKITSDLSSIPVGGYKLYVDGLNLILFNNSGQFNLYAIFDQHAWRGSFKAVYLGVKLAQDLSPIGFSVTKIYKNSHLESIFRDLAIFDGLITKKELAWRDHLNDYLIHSWSSLGTLEECLKLKLTLESKDSIALTLLRKVAEFHKYAVHKDLHTGNILIDQTKNHTQMYLNDLNSSVLKSTSQGIDWMTTNAINLSPELIFRALVFKNKLTWSEEFQLNLTHNDWELAERYQVGKIIAQMYLGVDPFEIAFDRSHVLAKYPLHKFSFQEIDAVPGLNYELDPYLEPQQLDQIQDIFNQAFSIYYERILCFDLENLETFNTLSDEYFRDKGKRYALEPYLSQADINVIDIHYNDAFKKMHQMLASELLTERLKFSIIFKHNIFEKVPEPLKAGLHSRLACISSLLDENPQSRPQLDIVANLLQQSII